MVKRVSIRSIPTEYRSADLYGDYGSSFSPDAPKPWDVRMAKIARQEARRKQRRKEAKEQSLTTSGTVETVSPRLLKKISKIQKASS